MQLYLLKYLLAPKIKFGRQEIYYKCYYENKITTAITKANNPTASDKANPNKA